MDDYNIPITPITPQHAQNQNTRSSSTTDEPWTHGPVSLPRGRSAKDPQSQITRCKVASLEDFEAQLKAYLEDEEREAEHSSCELSFWPGTSFLVDLPRSDNNGPPSQWYQNGSSTSAQYAAGPQQRPTSSSTTVTPMSIMEAINNQQPQDEKEAMKKQRAIAKTVVNSIQKVDGYRYSFHNNWKSREDEAFRFSYYCNDSLLNKDRAANGKALTQGKRARKPVYDCRGVLAVKFSATKQSLEVTYRHVPVHRSYEARAPPPRKDSKRMKILELTDPEKAAAIEAQKAEARKQKDVDPEKEKRKEEKRKKREAEKERQSSTTIESDLRMQSLHSLLNLIRTDEEQPAPESNPAPTTTPDKQQPSLEGNGLLKVIGPKMNKSCDSCRIKRVRCDSARPKCKECVEKMRTCVYSVAKIQATVFHKTHPASQQNSAIDLTREHSAPAPATVAASVPVPTTAPITSPNGGLESQLREAVNEITQLKSRLLEAEQRVKQLEDTKKPPQEEEVTATPIPPPPPAKRTAAPQVNQPQPPPPPRSRPQPTQGNQNTHSRANSQISQASQASNARATAQAAVAQQHRNTSQQTTPSVQRSNSQNVTTMPQRSNSQQNNANQQWTTVQQSHANQPRGGQQQQQQHMATAPQMNTSNQQETSQDQNIQHQHPIYQLQQYLDSNNYNANSRSQGPQTQRTQSNTFQQYQTAPNPAQQHSAPNVQTAVHSQSYTVPPPQNSAASSNTNSYSWNPVYGNRMHQQPPPSWGSSGLR
ncbi:hypothetical protein M501DRAFT_1013021 [Patellaria atrata CBS 101060]|uniref:Zn(2)-C6 fungal-type domain-containing protein n=1 Tax=Patellaria atrata CBS 101060 TaxID=1346257 RepID=A0A9P4SKV0_9PEZI|nr:hypothetical protein M501DRAFT_1013021 [Patellaria atrata CBS 101060]